VINKIEFSAKKLTSNAGLLLLLEHASKNGIFYLIDHDLVFENASTNKIKMNHIKTILCGNFIGIDKLERLKLLQRDPLICGARRKRMNSQFRSKSRRRNRGFWETSIIRPPIC